MKTTSLVLCAAAMLASMPAMAEDLTSPEISNCLAKMSQTTYGLIDIEMIRAYADKFPACKTTPPVPSKSVPFDPIATKTKCVIDEVAHWEELIQQRIASNPAAQFLATTITNAAAQKCGA